MPNKKCLYRERIESVDSIASIDSTSRKQQSEPGMWKNM